MRTILAFYDMNLEYGGPEEGGWWYDTGTFVRVIALFMDEAAAVRAQQRANRLLQRLQKHRTPISSITYTGGRYRAIAFTGLPPAHFPEQVPQYSNEPSAPIVRKAARLLPSEAVLVLTFDDLMVTSDAVERRIAHLRERLHGKEQEAEGLFTASAIRQLESAQEKLRRPRRPG